MSSSLLTKEQREIYDHSADWARSLLGFPRWNIVALSIHTPAEEFDDQLSRVTPRSVRFAGQLATANGPIGYVQCTRPIIDTVREIIIVGGDFEPSESGLGIVHALWANNMGVMTFEKRFGLTASRDAKYARRPRSHFEIPIPESPYGRIEIEESTPKWLLGRSPWHRPDEPDGFDFPNGLYYEHRDKLMKLASGVFWLESCGDGAPREDVLGIKDFIESQYTKTDEASAVRLFKSIAKYLAKDTDDMRYGWLYDAVTVQRYIYRGSLERVLLSTQAVHDVSVQIIRHGLKIPGLGKSGIHSLQAVFYNRLKEPTDVELFGQRPPEID